MDSVTISDGPINITAFKSFAKTNVNPDKDFLVTATPADGDEIQWKIFSAP